MAKALELIHFGAFVIFIIAMPEGKLALGSFKAILLGYLCSNPVGTIVIS